MKKIMLTLLCLTPLSMQSAENKKESEKRTEFEQKLTQAEQKALVPVGKRILLTTIEDTNEIRQGSNEPFTEQQLKSLAINPQAVKLTTSEDIIGKPIELNSLAGAQVWVPVDKVAGDAHYGSLVAVSYKKFTNEKGQEVGTNPLYGIILNSLFEPGNSDKIVPDYFDVQIGVNTILKSVPRQFVRIFNATD